MHLLHYVPFWVAEAKGREGAPLFPHMSTLHQHHCLIFKYAAVHTRHICISLAFLFPRVGMPVTLPSWHDQELYRNSSIDSMRVGFRVCCGSIIQLEPKQMV